MFVIKVFRRGELNGMKGCVGIILLKQLLYLGSVFMCIERFGKKFLINFFFVLQSNFFLVLDSLRGIDKRRNGFEFFNDIKKRKVDDKDFSYYVSK